MSQPAASDLTPARIHPATAPSGLSPRQEEFCREAALDPNATRAALRAGYSRTSARSQASRLLSTPPIQTRIAELRREISARDCADAESFMAKLEAIYHQAFEHCHLHAALRAVEMQMRLASRPPDGSRDFLPGGFPDPLPSEAERLPPPLTQNNVRNPI